jgi:hypothetical protein
MIDVPTLAREFASIARRCLQDRPGVFEVHFAGDEVSESARANTRDSLARLARILADVCSRGRTEKPLAASRPS